MTGSMAMMRAKSCERLGTTVLSRGTWTKRSVDLRTSREFSGTPKGGGKGGRAGQKQRRPGVQRGAEGGGTATARSVTKGGSSGLWMKRHLKDPYVSAAIEAGAPSRAAFKLVEINDKHRVLSAGDRVVDLGAAPGGWSMVAARIVHARGGRGSQQRGSRSSKGGARGGAPPQLPPPLTEARVEAVEKKGRRGGAVVAVDLLELDSDLPGVEAIRGDFRDTGVESKIFTCLSAKERPQGLEGGREQQQQHQPTARHFTPKPTAEQTDPANTKAIQRQRDVGSSTNASDGHGGRRTTEAVDLSSSSSEDAFLLRGTSASTSLLPRPEQPITDPLGDLFLAAKPPTAAEALARKETDSASPLDGRDRHDRGERLQDEGRRVVSNPVPPIRRANVVLSDMAPSFSGDRDTDQARVAGLVLDALAACLGDEASRRREPPRSAAGGGAENGGRSAGVIGGEGDDDVEGQRADRAVTTSSCSPSGGPRQDHGGAGSRPEQETLALDIGEPRGSDSGSRGQAPRHGTGLLARGGTFLGKFFAGRDEREVKDEAERLFEKVRVVKPPASRSGSGEMYLLATGFLLGGRMKRRR